MLQPSFLSWIFIPLFADSKVLLNKNADFLYDWMPRNHSFVLIQCVFGTRERIDSCTSHPTLSVFPYAECGKKAGRSLLPKQLRFYQLPLFHAFSQRCDALLLDARHHSRIFASPGPETDGVRPA